MTRGLGQNSDKHQYLRNRLRKRNLQHKLWGEKKQRDRRKIKKASRPRKSWKDNMKEKSGQVQQKVKKKPKIFKCPLDLVIF